MNLITGIIRQYRYACGRVLLLPLLLSACTFHPATQETEPTVSTDVLVTSPVNRDIQQTATFAGTTHYLQSNTVRTHISGIVKTVFCHPAENIRVGQPLFTVQPMEAAAIQHAVLQKEKFGFSQDTIYSTGSGNISLLNVQAGDFVQTGDVLMTYYLAGSLRVIAYIPVEQLAFVRQNMSCSIILPDGKEVQGRINGQLPSAPEQTQTQPFIVIPSSPLNFSENIRLSVQIKMGTMQNMFLVPKNVVLGNEEQTSFWVMKLMNDSMCVKTPVTKGCTIDSLVEVSYPGITSADRLVAEGAYGLPDTALVRMTGKY